MNRFRSFAIFDLETSNLPSFGFNKVGITEICIYGIRVNNLNTNKNETITESPSKVPSEPRILHKLNLLFYPRKRILPIVERITGLSNESLEEESVLDLNAATMIVNFLKHLPQPVCLVAHNGWNFDFRILKEKLTQFDIELPKDLLCVDTLAAFPDIDREREQLKLEADKEQENQEIKNVTSETKVEQTLEEVLLENDKIDWRAKNETTPHGQKRSKVLLDDNIKPKRRLIFSSPNETPRKRPFPPKGVYKLGSIYKRVLEEDLVNAHRAEADVNALTKLIQAYGEDFITYSEQHARPFAEVSQVGRPNEEF